jgi:hypothetical protein
LAVN